MTGMLHKEPGAFLFLKRITDIVLKWSYKNMFYKVIATFPF